MAIIRFSSLETLNQRKPLRIEPPSKEISDYFGRNVFDDQKMQTNLSSYA